jgi:hypothetical protein
MRKALKKLDGQRIRFSGRVERFGTKDGFTGIEPTVLLKHVKLVEDGMKLTDHVWINKGLQWANVQIGDVVAFDARVDSYLKGYWDNKSIDYRLTRPTKVEVTSSADLDQSAA